MTSNAGSDRSENLLGFGKTQADASKEKALKALEGFLRPEFIARVDEIVVFSPLTPESLAKIAELMLTELKDSLSERLIDFKFDNSVCTYPCREMRQRQARGKGTQKYHSPRN